MATPNLLLTPSGYKATKLYSVLPSDGTGDFTFSRSTTGTRVNKDGLIETVGINTPRLNWENECPHLLLEPTRTNLALHSGDISQWTNITSSGTVVATQNHAAAPDGTNSATRLQLNATTFALKSFSTTSINGDYSAFVYLKSNTASNQNVIVYGRNTTGDVKTVTPEWQRFEINGNATGGLSAYMHFGVNLNIGGDASLDILAWGGQLEVGNATSYIPTNGTAVTKTEDNIYAGGDANLFNDTEGTLFVEAKVLDNNTSKISVINISDGTLANRVLFQWGGALNRLRTYLVVGDSNQTLIETTSYNTGDYLKIAVRYKTNDVAFYVNGTKVNSDTTANTFPNGTLNTIDFTNGNLGSDYYFDGSLKQLMYFDTALSDSELQTLTS